MPLIDDIIEKHSDKEQNGEAVVPQKDYIESTIEDYEEFNKNAWNAGNGYETKTFPIFDEKMEGMEEGLYLFAGESNHGKSAILLELMLAYCRNKENKLFGLYCSLDDTKTKIIPRIIAADQQIPISVVSKPQRYQNMIDAGVEGSEIYVDMLKKREQGYQNLLESIEDFKIVDGTTKIRKRDNSEEDAKRENATLSNGAELIRYCQDVQAYIKARYGDDANILVGIDSVSDITWPDVHFTSDNAMNNYNAVQIKKWAVEILHAPIFGSIHLRKVDQNKRPAITDVKESSRYVYEANMVFLVYNDVSRNKESAAIYGSTETGEKQAVIELDWAKNKVSAFKGRTYHHFFTNYSKVLECDEDEMKRYNALLYTA